MRDFEELLSQRQSRPDLSPLIQNIKPACLLELKANLGIPSKSSIIYVVQECRAASVVCQVHLKAVSFSYRMFS